jgi:hypothetical protein
MLAAISEYIPTLPFAFNCLGCSNEKVCGGCCSLCICIIIILFIKKFLL